MDIFSGISQFRMDAINKVNELKSSVGNQIDQKIAEKLDTIGNTVNIKIQEKLNFMYPFFMNLLDQLLAVICIGIVGWMTYLCVRVMFKGKPEDTQQLLFVSFILLLFRIFNVLVRMGVHG